MPHPQSPHRPTSPDAPGAIGVVHPSKDPFCAPSQLHSQAALPSSSPRLFRASPAMEGHFADIKLSPAQQQQLYGPSLMDFNNEADASAFTWPTAYDSPDPRLNPDVGGYPVSAHFPQQPAVVFDQMNANGLPYASNHQLIYPSLDPDTSCPRSYNNGLGLSGPMGSMNMLDSYPPSAYVLDPPSTHDASDSQEQGASSQLAQLNSDYDQQYGIRVKNEDEQKYAFHVKPEDYSCYNSPRVSTPDPRCGTPHPDVHYTTPRHYNEEGTVDKDQPYAQLIYQALMEKSDKTMVLKDIYDWFTQNTDKCDKETKGWQNSIRHNLSMNGAFEKVEQPGEDAKKSFLWRLTPLAIRDGVKSTTRYRSKQPNKRGHRSSNPQPQRQASGAKGGQAARRAAKMRRSQRVHDGYMRSDPYAYTSAPAPYEQQGLDSPTEMTFPYPPSPYFASEVNFNDPYNVEQFGSPIMAPGMGMGMQAQSQSHLLQSSYNADNAYMLPQDPSEALFYGADDSPSPTDPDPPTPDYQDGSVMDMGPSVPLIFDGTSDAEYREF
ncbi:hypothetical protein K491DRAFT_351273 [Lophiostoma macrostomum CBS 122681]|uniref:Fork-head domain-containing protein n=1 Tax=Lophiostoma macrostomum CBS 122681 TaxID=1314788 RepID=A0A6A6TBI3_9PLEO|nr:hypothetical protein K491DRAFT_351273 [Lophiostoma macrostomum CBS 122681]